MTIIIVPSNLIPARARYQRAVVENGHIPGVLSGADLAGTAKSYAGRYAASRRKVAEALRPYGVFSRLVLLNSRWVRVWADMNDVPLRVKFNS